MFTTLFFTMALGWQSPATSLDPNSLRMVDKIYESEAREEALERAFGRRSDATKLREFELRFNDVAKALADFGQTWNHSRKVDERKAERLRKAWRELGKTDGWFDTSADSK
jgi:hypothetical protein